jgi:hypothetical protein
VAQLSFVTRKLGVILPLALLAFAALGQGCVAGGDELEECSPGRQVDCACGGDETGVQTCKADGTGYGACTGCGNGTGGNWPAGGTGGTGSGGVGGTPTGGAGGTGGAATGGVGGEGSTGPFSLNDPLKNAPQAGNPVGGAFGPDGWTVTAKTDRVWYAIPRLVSGSIQFTVTNITTTNLDLADHEIFSLYDAGYGITEPINYNPEFRDNRFKQLIRIYGQMVPERLGEQKFIMLMCPDGAPGYGTCACAKQYYDGDGTWGGNPSWDGSASVIKIRWGNGQATYSRDGVDVWTNDYSQSGLTFGPSDLHFTIGCPRADAISDAGMPIGATFSDVIVEGEQGPMTTCQ